MSERVTVALACAECEERNYKTSRRLDEKKHLILKKFCPTCKRHTVHKETK
jgi:large subunit ribosomal protein L33